MSGGVDSSVAAALLVESGYEVVGVTMKLWRGEDDPFAAHRYGGCCTIGATEDARRIADALDIPYYVLNMQDEFEARVVENFVDEYAAGRTPNPCARCNEFIKFDAFYDRAAELGCELVATGHYAQREYSQGAFRLRRGLDHKKDQSYVLGMLGQKELARTLFPIGGMEKSAVRERAASLGFCVANKPDSQEICFVEDGDHARFVAERVPQMALPGAIIDSDGTNAGRTQRPGALYRRAAQRPWNRGAAAALRHENRREKQRAGRRFSAKICCAKRLSARAAKWTNDIVKVGMRVLAQVRSHGAAVPAMVESATENDFSIRFEMPFGGASPGQMCVLYNGDEVLGAATIE